MKFDGVLETRPTKGHSVWLVAAENGYLPGGKVGGVGDVIRDLPIALAELGWSIRIITPAYGRFHHLPGARRIRRLAVFFGGKKRYAEVWRLQSPVEHVEIVVIAHALLDPKGDGKIYHEDDNHNPFATDAGKFAFFTAALAALVEADPHPPAILHLHDWHTGLLFALRAGAPEQSVLRQLRCVFTIHNLAYQGIRPLDGHASSLRAWFPSAPLPLQHMLDPRYRDCVNFMATAIRLADCCNTVSPTYAREITLPSDTALGFIGGEGLQAELQQAERQHRLKGILNGCMYDDNQNTAASWDDLRMTIQRYASLICAADPARRWLQASTRPRHLLSSIGRLVEQKVALMLQAVASHQKGQIQGQEQGQRKDSCSALEKLLQQLGPDSLFVLLGSGDQKLAQRLAEIASTHANFLFLNGYAEDLSKALYECGDLFLMPSSFEPCGISQMLAMRAGQVCVVHGVGGLKDTVRHFETGFVFGGAGPAEQASAFVEAVDMALQLREQHPAIWQDIRHQAAAERFSWKLSAQAYIDELYTHHG